MAKDVILPGEVAALDTAGADNTRHGVAHSTVGQHPQYVFRLPSFAPDPD